MVDYFNKKYKARNASGKKSSGRSGGKGTYFFVIIFVNQRKIISDLAKVGKEISKVMMVLKYFGAN